MSPEQAKQKLKEELNQIGVDNYIVLYPERAYIGQSDDVRADLNEAYAKVAKHFGLVFPNSTEVDQALIVDCALSVDRALLKRYNELLSE